MTKHWGGPASHASPALTYLPSPTPTAHRDPHLDFTSAQARAGNAHQSRQCHQSRPQGNIARKSPDQYWHHYPHSSPVQESGPRLERAAPVQVNNRAAGPMAKEMRHDPGAYYPAAPQSSLDAPGKQQQQLPPGAPKPWEPEGNSHLGKKKNYQRYPKPPYSYLAMIAMVIQNSPEKKLTLSEILKEISTLFPFFKGNYKGWRDSIRHNLSSYDCFVKVLKDPGKPQGKGNFWAVEVSRVPVELLKRQNTAVSRQDETIFAQDLAPYILQGHTHGHTHTPAPTQKSEAMPPLPPVPPRHPSPPPEDPYRPKLDSSFAIDSLLHSLRPSSADTHAHSVRAARAVGEGLRGRGPWGTEPNPQARPATPPRPRYSSSNRSASASSASPASSCSSDEDWRGGVATRKRGADGEAGSDGYEDSRPPPSKTSKRSSAPPWELPTSYAKYTPPNVVAPPSMRFNGGAFVPLGGLPFYSYTSTPVTAGHYVSHAAYWPLLPGGRVSLQTPPLLMDLDSMLQSVPPNKSVFDVLGPANHQTAHPHPPNQYALQNGPPLSRYPQY